MNELRERPSRVGFASRSCPDAGSRRPSQLVSRWLSSALSYDGGINFGVTGDRDSAPDIGMLCRGIERGATELLGATSPNPDKRPAGARARP